MRELNVSCLVNGVEIVRSEEILISDNIEKLI